MPYRLELNGMAPKRDTSLSPGAVADAEEAQKAAKRARKTETQRTRRMAKRAATATAVGERSYSLRLVQIADTGPYSALTVKSRRLAKRYQLIPRFSPFPNRHTRLFEARFIHRIAGPSHHNHDLYALFFRPILERSKSARK